jgi:hypothetical protein
MTSTTPTPNWWETLPAPRAHCPSISTAALMDLFDQMDIAAEPRKFLLVDVRREDWKVYYIIYYISLIPVYYIIYGVMCKIW